MGDNKRRFFETQNLEKLPILTKINSFMDIEDWSKEKLQEDLKNFNEIIDFALKNRELLDPYQIIVLYWKKKFIFNKKDKE